MECPAAQEFDLDQSQSVVPEHRPHLGYVHAGTRCAQQIVAVQTDPGEPGGGRSFAPLDEDVPRWIGETGTGKGEEARYQPGELRRFTRAQPDIRAIRHIAPP